MIIYLMLVSVKIYTSENTYMDTKIPDNTFNRIMEGLTSSRNILINQLIKCTSKWSSLTFLSFCLPNVHLWLPDSIAGHIFVKTWKLLNDCCSCTLKVWVKRESNWWWTLCLYQSVRSASVSHIINDNLQLQQFNTRATM